jgi:hypothetical protein
MTRLWVTGSFAIGVVMLLACATAVDAQAPASSRILTGFAAMSVGASIPTASSVTATSDFPAQWRDGVGSLSRVYQLGPRLQLDVSAGAVVAGHFVAAVSYTYFTTSRPAQATLVLTAPTYKGGMTVSTTDAIDPLTRSESAFHISGGYQGDCGAFEWQGFAGPSRFAVRQQLTSPGYFIPDEPDNLVAPLHLVDATASFVTATVWGFHVGGELRYFFSPAIGVGVTVRYSRATVTLPYAPTRSIESRVGGVDVVGGLRWRF